MRHLSKQLPAQVATPVTRIVQMGGPSAGTARVVAIYVVPHLRQHPRRTVLP